VSDGFIAPDAAEPIVGWRYRGLDPARRLLSSLTGNLHVWQPGRAFEAECRFSRRDPSDTRYQFVGGFKRAHHSAPQEGCTCGIHAAGDLRNLRAKMLFGLGLMVVGEVALWGKVIPGTRGYRAQFAYPRRLLVVQRTADWDQSGTVAALGVYGVPVEVVAYRAVSASLAETVAVAIGTLGEHLSALGEAMAGPFRRRGASDSWRGVEWERNDDARRLH
jgi:hypothetical protein